MLLDECDVLCQLQGRVGRICVRLSHGGLHMGRERDMMGVGSVASALGSFGSQTII